MDCAVQVQVLETCFVSPSEGTPKKQLCLSALDNLLAYRGHTPTVYFYRSSTAAADFFNVARLKESMAQTLVPFYPLAGRLSSVDTSDGHQLVIDCNADGALLVVARSDLTLDSFVDLKPSPELKTLFVPRVEPSSIMLGIQVTFLKCGGVALGTAFHHAAGDAISAFHFFQTWSAFSRSGHHGGAALLVPPCHDRELLRARSPPVVHPDALSLFCRQLSLTPPSEPVVNEVFTISKHRLDALKLACSNGASTFCAISALVWRCACVARRLQPDAKAHLTLPANIRRCLKPSLPDTYFGNALIFLETVALVRDVTSESLAATASRIRRVVGRMDDEVARSVIDYYKLAERDRRPPSGSLPVTELRVVSWLGMPVYDADYGWGKPEMFLGAEASRQGLVHLMSDGGDGVRVLVSMEASSMEEFGRLLYANLPSSVQTALQDKA